MNCENNYQKTRNAPSSCANDSDIFIKKSVRQRKQYKKIQKRMYTCTNDIMDENWKISNVLLINNHYINHHKKIPSINTFVKYNPHYVKHINQLNQMACDECTQFTFVYKPLLKSLLNNEQLWYIRMCELCVNGK